MKLHDKVRIRGISHGIERVVPGVVCGVIPAGEDHRELYKQLFPNNTPRLVSGGGKPRNEESYLVRAQESDSANQVVRWPRNRDIFFIPDAK